MNCPICHSEVIDELYTLYDDRYAYPGKFNLLMCSRCKHKFLDVSFSNTQLSELYSVYYPRSSFDVKNYKQHQESKGFFSWLKGEKASTFRWVPKNVKVLDIGCGFGESLGYHQARGCEVYGVEADSNIRKVADKFGFNVKVGLFDSKDYEENKFDYVTMDQVVEHLTDPINVLKGISEILKSNGQVILSTPNANGWGAKFFKKRWINWHTPYHLQFFSKLSLEKMADESGLEIEKIKTITNSRWINYQWIHSIYFPKEGSKSIFWSSNSVKLSLLNRMIFKSFSLFHRLGLDYLLTRLFDSIGFGDNYLIILRKKKYDAKT